MDNEEFQTLLEKHHITPLINYLKISWEDVEIGNRPDVVIKNHEGKIIGIENTEYHPTRKIQETEAKLDKMTVVATGGLGKIIYDETDSIEFYDPNLTLKGLNILYNKQ